MGGESDIYYLSSSKDGLKPIEDNGGTGPDFAAGQTEKFHSVYTNPFLGNFKGSDESMIPNMTARSLSHVPYDKTEKQIFYNLIKLDLSDIFGTTNYLDSWRSKMRSYDVSPYRKSVFSLWSNNRYNATAFLTEYLGMKFLLTNRHAVEKASQVHLFDSDFNMFEADVIAKTADREGMDLALLLPKDIRVLDRYKPLPLSLKPMPQTGGGLYTIGYPGNGFRFIKKPLLMFEQDKTSKYPLINVLPSVLGGTSGSPLMLPADQKGHDGVAGIAHIGGKINSFFIPTLTIKSFLKKTIRLGFLTPILTIIYSITRGFLKDTILLGKSFCWTILFGKITFYKAKTCLPTGLTMA